MSWLLAVISGHLLSATSIVLSKASLSKGFNNPYVFTFYVGLLGLATLVLIPFGVEIPSAFDIGFDLMAGGFFAAALLCFFIPLQQGETSRVVPLIGGGTPIFSLLFEWLFLDEQLNGNMLWAFAILVIGSVVITYEKSTLAKETVQSATTRYRLFGLAILSALLFAISFGLTKMAFESQPFISGFVWMRIGTFLAGLLIMLSATHRAEIIQAAQNFKHKAGVLYITSQIFGGLGFILINYGITLTSVAIVNALQGVQYVFLLLMVVLGNIKYPNLLKENLGKSSLMLKILGVIIISFGIYLITRFAT